MPHKKECVCVVLFLAVGRTHQGSGINFFVSQQ